MKTLFCLFGLLALPVAAAEMQHQHDMSHKESGAPPQKGASSMAIPVSDGAAAEDIPVPFPEGMHHMHAADDPLLAKWMVDELEIRQAVDGHYPMSWDAEAWVGQDINKLWLKSEGERSGGHTQHGEIQALYSRAVAPFWDMQLGVRQDTAPENRTWLALGAKGLSPYWFDYDIAIFVGNSGRTALRLKAEYELLLTQRWMLLPKVEANVYGKNDPAMGRGAGLSDIDVGLRLSYAFRREFAPYIGVLWSKKLGNAADLLREQGEKNATTQWVAGVRFWF